MIPNLASVVISKEDPMGFVTHQDLVSNDNIWQNPAQPPLFGTYQWTQGTMQICCINYGGEDADFRPTEVAALSGAAYSQGLHIYPNPAKDGLTIEYQMKTKERVTIIVYDVMGRKIAEWHPQFNDNSQLCKYEVPASAINLQNGNYFITVTNGIESYRSKLTVIK